MKNYEELMKKLYSVTDEELAAVKLPISARLIVVLKAIPLVILGVGLMIVDFFLTLLRLPGEISDLLTAEEALKETVRKEHENI